MKNKPLVSIILPTYNGEKYILEAIRSCLRQTYKNIELIIVDDGSTDRSAKIIRSFRDSRIMVIEKKSNEGLPKALNSGFEIARGEYLTWISDDNLFHPKALEKLLKFLKAKKTDFVFSAYYACSSNLKIKKIVQLSGLLSLKNDNPIGPSFLYTQKIKKVIGEYNPEAEFVEDYDYWIRISKKFPIYYLNLPLYFYRKHKNNLSSKKIDEVNVASILLNLRHGLIDFKDAANQLIYTLVTRKKIESEKMLDKFIISNNVRKIKKILESFQKGKIPLPNAKSRLLKIH